MMHITQGCTRIVILTRVLAIKIALPLRPLAPFTILLRHFLRGDLQGKLRKHDGNLIRFALRIMTTAGIEANRREIRISREHPEYPVAPVLRSYLWGFVIVMARGEPIEKSSEPWSSRRPLPFHLQESDIFYPHNTCRFGSALRLIDYGDPSAEEVLPLLFSTPDMPPVLQTE